MSNHSGDEGKPAQSRGPAALLGCGLLALCVWAYMPTLAMLVGEWKSKPEYSHGFVVPLFAAYLLYARRKMLAGAELRPSWLGPLFLAAAGCLRLAGARLGVEYLDYISLLPCMAGLAVLLGGWPALWWSWPAALFLLFMLPLPFSVATSLSGGLQWVATLASGYTLQIIGLPVVIEGNTLIMGDHRIEVAEACSGLSMLYVFLAIATGVALLIDRPWIDRAVVLLSAVPVAVIANIIRIAVTALAYRLTTKEWGDFIFHDLAGWLMMPLALAMTWVVLKLIDLVLVPVSEDVDVGLVVEGLRDGAVGRAR